MLRRLIIFLIRCRLKLRPFEEFQFTNQKSEYDRYWFGKYNLWKVEFTDEDYYMDLAHVSLNWLLSEECEIKKIGVKA